MRVESAADGFRGVWIDMESSLRAVVVEGKPREEHGGGQLEEGRKSRERDVFSVEKCMSHYIRVRLPDSNIGWNYSIGYFFKFFVQWEQAGLSSEKVNIAKQWYLALNYSLFALAFLQVDSQYDLLQQEEITAWSSKVANSQRSRAQKYRDLREHYKKKYYRNQGEAA
eukprot:gene18231-18488_t